MRKHVMMQISISCIDVLGQKVARILLASLAVNSPQFCLADQSVYSGNDGNGSETVPLTSWPNSTNARLNFLKNLSSDVGNQDFELVPSGSTAPIRLVFSMPGLTSLTGVLEGSDGRIFSVQTGSADRGNYGTSPTKFWSVVTGAGSNFRIKFDRPIAAVGFNGIDIGDFDGILDVSTFKDGNIVKRYEVPLSPGIEAYGSVLFYGIIENEADQFDTIEFSTQDTGEIADIFSFDDIIAAYYYQIINGYSNLYEQSLQPYAANPQLFINALSEQHLSVLENAGKCDRYGWVLDDIDYSSPAYKYLHGNINNDWKFCLFAEGGTSTASLSSQDQYGSYDINSNFFRTGFEYRISPTLTSGAVYGYTSPNLDSFTLDGIEANIQNKLTLGSLYLVYRPDSHWLLSIIGSAGVADSNSTRTLYYTDELYSSATASWDNNLYGIGFEVGYEHFFSKIKTRYSPTLKAVLNYQWINSSTPSITEVGDGQLATVNAYNVNTDLLGIGISYEHPIKLEADGLALLIPKIILDYQYDVNGSNFSDYTISASSNQDGSSYSTSARLLGNNRLRLAVLLDINLGDSFSIYTGASYLGFDSGSGYLFEGGIRVRM